MSWLERLTAGWGLSEARGMPRGEPARVEATQRVLAELSPALAADGGSVHLVAIEGDEVQLRLEGTCARCHAAEATMSTLVEPRLRAALPWLHGVRWRR